MRLRMNFVCVLGAVVLMGLSFGCSDSESRSKGDAGLGRDMDAVDGLTEDSTDALDLGADAVDGPGTDVYVSAPSARAMCAQQTRNTRRTRR